MLIAFHKPYGVLSQFTPDASQWRTLADFGFPQRVYPLGRLDADSEGLLLLSDEAGLNTQLLDRTQGHARTYWAQVERIPSVIALRDLAEGVLIEGRRTLPCVAGILDPQPMIAPRDPPIRFRKNVPDCWVELTLTEGRNRQVRKMTAAIGHPTLRLIRVAIGQLRLDALAMGQWRELSPEQRDLVFAGKRAAAEHRKEGRPEKPGSSQPTPHASSKGHHGPSRRENARKATPPPRRSWPSRSGRSS